MRVLPSLIASCFAGVAASSTVYEFYHDHSGDATSVSPEELALSLSERLGVSRYHKLGSQENLLRLQLDGGKSGMFQERIEEDFILSIAGAYSLGAAQPQRTRIGLKDMPKTSAFGELMEVFVRENRQFLEAAAPKVVDMSPWGGMCVGVSENEISLDPKEYTPSIEASGDDYGTPSEAADLFREYGIIKKITERDLRSLPGQHLASCHVAGVEKYVKRYGPESKQALNAAQLYLSLIDDIPAHIRSTILLLSVTKGNAGISAFKIDFHKAYKRSEEEPLSLTAHSSPSAEATSSSSSSSNSQNPKRILGPISRCYASQNSCNDETNACSGRGECVKSSFPTDCWSCTCKGPDGNKTDKWAGAACQKEDISVPFNLLLVFGVIIVLVSIWAVGLLYSIGDEPLPSVLSAGVAPAKRG
ncbi:hypothetical protein L873DRAFT_1823001 [Choiromyces venosus 120613-1]|uniref:Uncharacterized protein n=1 Tax=Choiromyces venosus 120613-1 TaxID=1336337 RepID=A0A3N4IT39_9PEZI|nr:hypothetical protein L873DRAFT_1823001 [Choiromyces venosus 120613-1]